MADAGDAAPLVAASTGRPRSRVWTGGSSRWCAAPAATPRCRRCPAATAGCSSSWSATTRASSAARADALLADAEALDGVRGRPTRSRPWPCGRSARTAPGWPGSAWPSPAYPGWEDAAVPPAQLGAYLRDFDALLAEHGLDGLPYGHFGDGCVHVRIDFPLTRPGGAAVYRTFVEQAAAARGRLRRLDVGRARRRAGPLGAAAGDVLPRRDRPVRAGQGVLRPGEPAQSRRAGRPAAGRRRSAGRPRWSARVDHFADGGAPLHRRRQVPGRQHRAGSA